MTSRRVPEGFQFGVATAGYQIEGGYNGPGEPANNWQGWESEGRVEPSGIALDFWNRYEDQLDKAASLGCNSFRLSVEWARCEPSEATRDPEAMDRYTRILSACRERNLEPLVTLHHFTHPAWLGQDFWLRSDAPELFAGWVDFAVRRLGGLCSRWVTINEPNDLAIQSYLVGGFPPGHRARVRSAARALDNLLTAHVMAYGVVHRLQEGAVVSTNPSCSSVYELNRLVIDILLPRATGITVDGVREWLPERRSAYYSLLDSQQPDDGDRRERAMRWMIARTLPLERLFPRAVAAVYASPHQRPLDCVQIDYYDPLVSGHMRLPGHRSAGGRVWEPSRTLWDDVVDPARLVTYAVANHEPGLELWVVENGLSNRVRRGRSFPRSDGWRRPRYLEENLDAVMRAIDSGIPIAGYWHWTLADNYEWGSYEPRFGLFGVDRERGLRWSQLDSMGNDSAGAYRALIRDLTSGPPG